MNFSVTKIVEYTLSGFIIVAIISVLVAKNSNAPAFLQTLGSTLSNILGSVVAPATQATNSTSNANSNLLGSANIGGVTAPTVPSPNATSANTGTTDTNQ